MTKKRDPRGRKRNQKLPPRPGETHNEAEKRRAAYRRAYHKRKKKVLAWTAEKRQNDPVFRRKLRERRKHAYYTIEKPKQDKLSYEKKVRKYTVNIFSKKYRKPLRYVRVNGKIKKCFPIEIFDVFRMRNLKKYVHHEIFFQRLPKATFITPDSTMYFSEDWVREFIRLYFKLKMERVRNTELLKEMVKHWSVKKEEVELDNYDYDIFILRRGARGRRSYRQILKYFKHKTEFYQTGKHKKDHVRISRAERRAGKSRSFMGTRDDDRSSELLLSES